MRTVSINKVLRNFVSDCLVFFVLILSSGNMRPSENIKMPEEIMREMVFAEKKTKFKNNLRSNGKGAMEAEHKEQGHSNESSTFQRFMEKKRDRNY